MKCYMASRDRSSIRELVNDINISEMKRIFVLSPDPDKIINAFSKEHQHKLIKREIKS